MTDKNLSSNAENREHEIFLITKTFEIRYHRSLESPNIYNFIKSHKISFESYNTINFAALLHSKTNPPTTIYILQTRTLTPELSTTSYHHPVLIIHLFTFLPFHQLWKQLQIKIKGYDLEFP